MDPHAFTPHPDRHGCRLCPLSQHHSIHTGDLAGAQRPPEEILLYPSGDRSPHVGRRGSDPGQSFPTRRRDLGDHDGREAA